MTAQEHAAAEPPAGRKAGPARAPVRLAGLAVVSIVALGAAACGASRTALPPSVTSATPATTALVLTSDGLGATLEQYREDQLTKTIEIQVVNRSTRTVQLDRPRLEWVGFTPTPATDRRTVLGPGQVVDLPVPLGDAVCTDPPRVDSPMPSASARALVTATWLDGGSGAPVEIPVTDTRGVLSRIFRPDCARQTVAWAASVSFGASWVDGTTPDGKPAAFGTLRLLRRHGGDPVTVTQVNGSVLLSIAPQSAPAAGRPLLTLGAAEAGASLPVVVTQSGRCEAHVLAESKHTFLLPVALAVGDAPVVLVDVVPDDAAKLQLARLINRACGVG